jgi:hypothetical protein
MHTPFVPQKSSTAEESKMIGGRYRGLSSFKSLMLPPQKIIAERWSIWSGLAAIFDAASALLSMSSPGGTVVVHAEYRDQLANVSK